MTLFVVAAVAACLVLACVVWLTLTISGARVLEWLVEFFTGDGD